jgi:hypothetical protein
VLVRQGFAKVVANGFAGMGFPREGPMFIIPDPLCEPDSDLTPVKEGIDKICSVLTGWKPNVTVKGVNRPAPVKVTGKDYPEALAKTSNLFLTNMWSDGLPIVPPTKERVELMLTGTSLPRDQVIGKIMPHGGIASTETLAACLAMAGGRPEYMPVLIAAVEAMVHPDFMHHFMNTTTGNVSPFVVVNGPMAEQIRLASGYGCMSLDPTCPAGPCIGRAIRFVLLDIGRGIPGISNMSIHGANRIINCVFAEDESHFPAGAGWEPLSVDQGFTRGSNLVTVYAGAQMDFIFGAMGLSNSVDAAKRCIRDYTWVVGARSVMPPASFKWGRPYQKPTYTEKGVTACWGIMIFAPNTARGFASAGYKKEDVRRAVWEQSALPWDFVRDNWGPANARKWAIDNSNGVYAEGKPWPVSFTPKSILMAIAGGEAADKAIWILGGGASGWTAVSKEIKLPERKQWDKLLAQAEQDMGPLAPKTY